jgi:aminopeptidase N
MLVRETNDSIPVQYYVWQADSVKTAKFLPTVKQMISGLGNLFGPYPWDKYGMSGVSPFLYGGMEHQTMTTLQQSYETEEFVVVHELTHQWWGDLVTCGTWSDIWLNESFATYGEVLWSEITGGVAGRKSYMFGMQGFANASWQGAVYNPEGQGYYLFDDLVYNKGGWVLHTLRGAIGDSAFFQSLRAWRQAYGQASATTSDFQGVVESVVGNGSTARAGPCTPLPGGGKATRSS